MSLITVGLVRLKGLGRVRAAAGGGVTGEGEGVGL